MRYKLLGKSGLRVSELALGGMTFGEDLAIGTSKEESRSVFEAYAESGGNFIDTANYYTKGTSEKYLGEFIASDRDHFILATKYTLVMKRGDPNASGNHRKNMVRSLEASLKRLSLEYIDLYWLHVWDFMTPIDEVLRALDDMVRSGKVLYIGISDTPAWIVSRANTLAELRGWSQFVGLQIKYSLVERSAERDLLPMARALDIGTTAWGVLASGVLTGKYNRKDPPKDGRLTRQSRINDKDLAIAAEVVKIAEEIGHTPSQVALNWVRQQPGVVIPIIGARTTAQVQDNLSCIEFTLNQEQMERLAEASKIELGFPHDFLGLDDMIDLVYSGMFGKIDNHRI